ncbi:MAG: hypothetical protein GXO10_04740 [Crenarchaeota archaeon]|nr:hypothetical protein [Thermoproteota archaeon]
MHHEHRLYRADTVCPSCGIAMPSLPMCSITHTCVECARRLLKNECDSCPDRDECEKEVQGIKMFRELEKRLSMILPDLIEVLSREVNERCITYCGSSRDSDINMFIQSVLSVINLLKIVKDPRTWIIAVFRPSMIKWIVRAPTCLLDLSQRCLLALKDYSSLLEIDSEVVINIFKIFLLKFIEDRCEFKSFVESTFRTDLARLLLNYRSVRSI